MDLSDILETPLTRPQGPTASRAPDYSAPGHHHPSQRHRHTSFNINTRDYRYSSASTDSRSPSSSSTPSATCRPAARSDGSHQGWWEQAVAGVQRKRGRSPVQPPRTDATRTSSPARRTPAAPAGLSTMEELCRLVRWMEARYLVEMVKLTRQQEQDLTDMHRVLKWPRLDDA